jgi:hypothetical protein
VATDPSADVLRRGRKTVASPVFELAKLLPKVMGSAMGAEVGSPHGRLGQEGELEAAVEAIFERN